MNGPSWGCEEEEENEARGIEPKGVYVVKAAEMEEGEAAVAAKVVGEMQEEEVRQATGREPKQVCEEEEVTEVAAAKEEVAAERVEEEEEAAAAGVEMEEAATEEEEERAELLGLDED